MAPQILGSETPLTEADLAKAEAVFGTRFPESYKIFISKHNGGYPDPDGFRFADGSDASTVDKFLSIGKANHSNLLTYLKTYRGRVADGFLPIAHDPGGNLVVIGVADPYMDRIYFWDHEFEAEDGQTANMSNMHLIAENLTTFLDGLFEVEA